MKRTFVFVIPADVDGSLDSAIEGLKIVAKSLGQEFWSYAEKISQLFTIGGLFYELVKRDLGDLEDNYIYILSRFPGKVSPSPVSGRAYYFAHFLFLYFNRAPLNFNIATLIKL